MAPAMGQTAQVNVAVLRVDIEPGLDRTKESPVPCLGTFVAGCGASAFRLLSSAFGPSYMVQYPELPHRLKSLSVPTPACPC